MPRVFISYRRDDTADAAGRLYQNLVGAIGDENVFKDVDSIPGGAPFSDVIAEYINRADFVFVLIGSDWVDVVDEAGERRLMRDDDLVRKEVVYALNSSAIVIPLLVSGASMPSSEDLPEDLQRLVSVNAMKLRRDPDFEIDFARLLAAIGIRSGRSLRKVIAVSAVFFVLLILGYFLFQFFELDESIPDLNPTGKSKVTAVSPDKSINDVPIVAYDPSFLGGGHVVPLPRLTDSALSDTFNDGKPVDYLHYSLVMNEQRSLATFVAINYDRSKQLSVRRTNADWLVDKRLPLGMQREQSLYQNNPWDRGHLVQRQLVSWEDDLVSDPKLYQRAVSFYPATVPQHENFNRTTWLYLERYVQEVIAQNDDRMIVFAGPVLRDNDVNYRSTRIPRSYWKVVVTIDPENKSLLKVYAFVADQYREDPSTGDPIVQADGSPSVLERINSADFSAEDYATSLSSLSALVGLDFGYLEQYDVFKENALSTSLIFDEPRIEFKGRELFSDSEKYAIHISGSKNKPKEFVHLESFHIETQPENRIKTGVFTEGENFLLLIDGIRRGEIEIPVIVAEERPNQYRFCWNDVIQSQQACSGWYDWGETDSAPSNEPLPPREVRNFAKLVIANNDGFVLVSEKPLRITKYAGGLWKSSNPVEAISPNAIPVSIVNAENQKVMIATNSPTEVLKTDLAGVQDETISLDNANGLRLQHGSPVSSTPEKLVVTDDIRWLKTGGGVGEPGLFYWKRGAWGWSKLNVVPYLEDISFELADLKLKTHDRNLWGVATDTTPSSLYQFGTEDFQVWEGHDYELVSCATDTTNHPAGLVILDCENKLKAIKLDGLGALSVNGEIAELDSWPTSMDTWETHVMSSDGGAIAVALNQHARSVEEEKRRTRIFYVADGRPAKLFESDNAHVVSLALAAGRTAVVFEGIDGGRDFRLFRNP